tara:strand:+ start:89001 stop:89816 length:816 start_codon:yes stop_codon:yes gene_type:complete
LIIKKRVYTAKKVNPLIGVLLLLISIFLLILTLPLGFLFGLLYNLATKRLVGVGEYCLKIAISIDQLGNVAMQHLLNLLWLKSGNYPFGNRDETISSAIGRNKRLGTLNAFGRFIDKLLDVLDPNHSLDSIDYYIEPTEQIEERVAWVQLVEGKILMVREHGKSVYGLPYGKREMGKTDLQSLQQGIWQQLMVTIKSDSLVFIGIFEAKADDGPPGNLIRTTCYYAQYTGEILPGPEAREVVALTYADRNMVGEVDQLIFDFLHKRGVLTP